MTTNTQIFDRALFEIGVLHEGQTATAEQANDLMAMMNAMIAQWKIQDKDLSYAPQDTVSATIPIPGWAENAVVFNLAVHAAPSFKKQISQVLAIKADESLNALGVYLMNEKIRKADMSHLPQGQRRYRYDIDTDS